MRHEDDTDACEINAITHVTPQWIMEVQESYTNDSNATEIINAAAKPHYTYTNELLRYKGRIFIDDYKELKEQIIKHIHDSSMGGHSGMAGSYMRAKSSFYWKGMKQQIHEHVSKCDVCKMSNHDGAAYPGLLQPLQIPKQAWTHISMDFVEGLPKSDNKDSILVVVDMFTKYSHLFALSHPYTASHIAKILVENIYKLHGLPTCIVTDRDKIFTSNF